MVLHGVEWCYCMVLQGIACYSMVLVSCTILHYLALSCNILNHLALSCTILNHFALSCTILHIRYICSQQMSPVIAFDIAVMVQKVKVLCCYRGAVCSEKVGGGGSVIGRDGYQIS